MTSRKKQILTGVGLILLFFLILGVVAAMAYMPGFIGEIGRHWLALVTSPFFMEVSLAFLAFLILLAINGLRRKRAGSDWVEITDSESDNGAE